MATLAELRQLVRTQTETTSPELPNTTIDWYLRQAFARTIASESTWPFYETQWVLTIPAGETRAQLPSNVNRSSIRSVISDEYGPERLQMIDHETAEDIYFGRTVTTPSLYEFSVWGDYLYFWPKVDYPQNIEVTMRGFRTPSDWVSEGDSGVVDADERLHLPLVHYAIAMAYAQQEDDTLENVYMQRWQMDVNAARSAIMEPPRHLPFTFGGSKRKMWVT